MKIIVFLIFLFTITITVKAQVNNIAQFAIWKPNEGEMQNFENGYKQHLNWHKMNNDKWSWYGWFIVSGPRYGQFVDATFNHSWAEFDNPVKPEEDMADNRVHVFPFGEIQNVFKVSFMPNNSTTDTFRNKLKIVRLVTINTNSIDSGLKIVDKLKDFYILSKIESFRTYKLIDGGSTNEIILMLGFSSWNNYSITEQLKEKIEEIEQQLKHKVITSVNSETMIYRTDLSLFPN
jgi:hypothetical protein